MSHKTDQFKTTNVVSIAATHLLHDTFSSFFAALIPLLIEKLHFSYAVAGTLVADKMAIRSAIVLTPIVTIVTMSLPGLAPSIPVLAILMFVCGIRAAVLHTTAPVFINLRTIDKRHILLQHKKDKTPVKTPIQEITPFFIMAGAIILFRGFSNTVLTNGIYMTVNFAASSIVALLIGVLADRYGFVKTYQITAVLSLCAVPLTLLVRDPSRE